MKTNPLFTIILAGYQTEPYLPKALESIEKQTFPDFETICYVEESIDNSLAICQSMAERDSRFIVATGPKSGAVSSTRNYGIDHAKGKYLVILDGDDWITPDMLEKLSIKLQKTGVVDILSFAAVSTETEDVDWEHAARITNFRAADADDTFTGLDAIRRVGRNGGRMNNQTVLSIYRTEFLREHQLYQTPGKVMEDFEWTPRTWFFAQRFAYLDEVFYIYRRRPNSLTTAASSRLIFDLAHQVRSLMAFAAMHSIPDDILAIWSNQWLAILNWFMFHPVSSRKISDDDRVKALAILFEQEGMKQYRHIVARASFSRRIVLPLILLASKGFPLPAKFFFRKIYYPLVERKGKMS